MPAGSWYGTIVHSISRLKASIRALISLETTELNSPPCFKPQLGTKGPIAEVREGDFHLNPSVMPSSFTARAGVALNMLRKWFCVLLASWSAKALVPPQAFLSTSSPERAPAALSRDFLGNSPLRYCDESRPTDLFWIDRIDVRPEHLYM